MNKKVKKTLNAILTMFQSGNIPEAIAYAMVPVPGDIPSSKWSLTNRTLMFIAGTPDARGFRQWQQVDRFVRKGSKAFHILVPFFKKVEDEDEEEEDPALSGFGCRPVFRVEDTEGKALEYEIMDLPDLPLLERAKEWGIKVRLIPGRYRYAGYYCQQRKEIVLATPEEKVFFHELSHAAHEKVKGSLKKGQNPFKEIVAELSAAALCKLVGKRGIDFSGNAYRYIKRYGAKIRLCPYCACLKVLAETEKVLNLILNNEDNEGDDSFYQKPTFKCQKTKNLK